MNKIKEVMPEFRVSHTSLISATLEKVENKIKALPITRPDYESDDYDSGLKAMKIQVLAIIEGIK